MREPEKTDFRPKHWDDPAFADLGEFPPIGSAPPEGPPQFSDQGIPIVTLSKKLEYLRHCLREEAREDALGHLFDLIHFLNASRMSTNELVDTYGMSPTPVIDDRRNWTA